MSELPELSDEERSRYAWQMWTPDIGEEGQRRLKAASVLVSRLGGVGGTVAYYLAAAGVGKLVLAHAGNVKPSDLNRQLLMTTNWLGNPRIESATRRLKELNPHTEIVPVAENISSENADRLVSQVDLVVDAAPLFSERYAMNEACVRSRKPLVESAMYDFSAQLTTIIPGRTPCLSCIYPDDPANWKREFPVFGAVSGTVASLAAVEVIKLVTGVGTPLTGQMLWMNLREMDNRKLPIERRSDCPVCGSVDAEPSTDSNLG
ncbi:Sulfur carrier protein ThiS adenylyltransferase [Thalassoglobus neptunius]|uniref:Sulfur carrier protein ThiS adenylyltransferase n=1 Tax=Thalassoglobus neptunius TaxID=1938619 RepID=A0A5C5WM29_9PLAN|nr:HesA/MoeB/ThiF family protein [Thalassoglobus neptunius]TWT51864.1 Sulfur carrier protein ThiS adenylyltransferase [Thalassoglobus neptunius]